MSGALLITRRLGCGGVERSVLTLAEHLDCRLAPLEAGGVWEGEAARLVRGGRPWPGFLRHVGYVLRLTALTWKLRPRVLVTFCLDSLISACFVPRPPGTAWVAYVGSDVHEHLEREYRPFHRLLQSLLGWVYRRPPRLVAVSQGLRRALGRNFGIPLERIVVLANPVDVARVRAASSAPGEEFVLGVGRLIPMKGFDLLLRAVAPLPGVRVVILGEGRERGRLLKLAQELGMADRLELRGYDANPWRSMRAATLVVVPSRSEGFSNVIAEALASGAALVVSDCPHGPRELVEDGVSARLVPSEDVEALREALRDLLADPDARHRLRAGALARAAEFDVARVCPQWVEFLDL